MSVFKRRRGFPEVPEIPEPVAVEHMPLAPDFSLSCELTGGLVIFDDDLTAWLFDAELDKGAHARAVFLVEDFQSKLVGLLDSVVPHLRKHAGVAATAHMRVADPITAQAAELMAARARRRFTPPPETHFAVTVAALKIGKLSEMFGGLASGWDEPVRAALVVPEVEQSLSAILADLQEFSVALRELFDSRDEWVPKLRQAAKWKAQQEAEDRAAKAAEAERLRESESRRLARRDRIKAAMTRAKALGLVLARDPYDAGEDAEPWFDVSGPVTHWARNPRWTDAQVGPGRTVFRVERGHIVIVTRGSLGHVENWLSFAEAHQHDKDRDKWPDPPKQGTKHMHHYADGTYGACTLVDCENKLSINGSGLRR